MGRVEARTLRGAVGGLRTGLSSPGLRWLGKRCKVDGCELLRGESMDSES